MALERELPFDKKEIYEFEDERPEWLKGRPAVLSDRDILRLVEEGEIKITPEPDWKDALNSNRVDLLLGEKFARLDYTKLDCIDVSKPIPEKALIRDWVPKGGKIIIPPQELILASTEEIIEVPDYLVGRLEGKSSVARHGIRVEAAPWFDAEWKGNAAMEIVNQGRAPVAVLVGMPICSFSFLQLSSPAILKYVQQENARYRHQSGPEPGKTHLQLGGES